MTKFVSPQHYELAATLQQAFAKVERDDLGEVGARLTRIGSDAALRAVEVALATAAIELSEKRPSKGLRDWQRGMVAGLLCAARSVAGMVNRDA